MITVSRVHKKFGKIHAVRGITFELVPGQVAGLLGPNGAGKTSTIRMITGYSTPDSGQVSVGGYDALLQPLAARRCVGYLPEAAPLYPEMRTVDYLSYRARLYGMDRAMRASAVRRAIDRCWLGDVVVRRVGKLSKGYKQRVGLAAALLHEPPVLVLDEPTNGLDPSQIRETRELIKELSRERTMLVSSHILAEIERLCNRVIIMARGEVRADADPAALVARARERASYVVQCRRSRPGDDERMYKVWQNIPHIADIQPDTPDRAATVQGWSIWMLAAKPGAPDLREQIAQAALDAGVLIRELRHEVPTLEKIFLKLVEEAPEQAQAVPA